jgi:hypothetical protein
MRHKRKFICVSWFLVGAFAVSGGRAAESDRNWGLTPYLGLYEPSLKLLNEGEFRSPYQGTADLIDQFGNNNNVTVPFIFRAPLPELSPGPIAGLEFQWRINDKHALLIGGGNWEATSSASAQGIFPVQGAFESVISQRKADISFTEFYLGWRYNVIHKPGDHDFYFNFSIHDIFDVSYREDFSLLFLSGPPRGFRKSSVIESRATGLLLLQGSGGGEWFISDWFSLGVEAGYDFGLKALRLGDGNLNTDFQSTDNLFLELPMIQTSSGTMQYKTENGAEYRDLRLDFEGWKALLKATIYY